MYNKAIQRLTKSIAEGLYYGQPDLAEGLPVVGTPLVAHSGQLVVDSGATPLADGGFESHSGDTFSAWDWQDGAGTRTFADTATVHGGSVAARIDAGSGNARQPSRRPTARTSDSASTAAKNAVSARPLRAR